MPQAARRGGGAVTCRLALVLFAAAFTGSAHAASADRAYDLYRQLERRCPATHNYFDRRS